MDSFTPAFSQDPKKNEAPQDLSALKFFSLALVVETPAQFPSSIIKVTPIESLSTQDSGGISKKPVAYEQTHPEEGGGYHAPKSIDRGNAIEAEWMPLSDSNRDTAPCVYKDETVLLLKYADVQKYYWVTIKRQPQLRRKEMVRWGVSNETAPLKEHNKATTYYTELNALDRYFEISSPTSGESQLFRIRGDIAQGLLVITDDKGNEVLISSTQGQVTVNAQQKVVVTSATSIELNSASVVINADSIQLNGAVQVSKALQVAGGISATGGSGGSVAARFSGDVLVNGHFQSNTINPSNYTGVHQFEDKALVQASTYTPPAAPAAVTPEPSSASNWNDPNPSAEVHGPVPPPASPATAALPDASPSPVPTPKLEVLITPVKESVATVSKLGSQLQDKAGALVTGVQGLSAQAQNLQKSVSGTVSQVTGTVQNTLTQVRSTVMDPINQVSREVLSLTNSATGQIQSVGQNLYQSVGSVTQPLNQLSQSLTGKSLAGIDSVNQRLQALPQALNLSAVNSLTSSLQQSVGKVNYMTQTLNQELLTPFRTVTDTVGAVQSQTQMVTKQLSDLANIPAAFSTETKKALGKLR